MLARNLSVAILSAAVIAGLVYPATGARQQARASDPPTQPTALATEYEPPRTRDDIDPSSFAEGDLRAIAERFGVSMEEARWRMAVEEASIGLEERLRRRWPDTYAGHWVAGGGADPHVAVAFKEQFDEQQRRSELRSEFAYPEALELKTAARSFEDLRAVRDRIRADRISMRRGRGHENSRIASTRGEFDLALDLSGNTISISLPSEMADEDATNTKRAFREHYRAPWIVFDRGVAREGCSKSNCQWTMRGGIRLLNDTATCTSAFGARGIDVGYYFVLSAGHCSGAWRRNGTNGHYGQVYSQQNSGTVDAERIRHETNPWTTEGKVYLQQGDTRSIGSYFGYHSYSEGQTVVMASKDEPAEWGAIIDAYVDVNNHIDFVKTDYCMIGGDSGSAVVRNTSALGIAESFTDACPTTSYFGRIHPAMQAMYVNLLAG